MKYSIFFLASFFLLQILCQTTVKFETKKIYIGEIDIKGVYKVKFNFENISNDNIDISYEPITDLINAECPKYSVKPKQKSSIQVNFYPETEGPFNERIYVYVNKKEKIELTIFGKVSSISKNYRSLTENSRLFGDREIGFKIVDGLTYEGVPFAKVFIRNIENRKSYIGLANQYGILLNRLPEGKYHIQALVDNYKKEIIDLKLDANLNTALVLLDRKESLDSLVKKDTIQRVETKMVENIEPLKEVSENELDELKLVDTIIFDLPEESVKQISEPIPSTEIIVNDEEEKQTRRQLNIILLIDVSKSMAKNNRIDILKKSISHLIQNYEPLDQMAILTFNDEVRPLMNRMKIENKEDAISLVQTIQPSGSTDGVLGLDKAFEILQENYISDAINMVILATDGRINKYASDDKLMMEKIEKMNASGILTSVVSFANSNYNESKMQQVAKLGGGVFIDMKKDTEQMESALLDEIYYTLIRIK